MVTLGFFCLCPFVLPLPMLKSSHQAMIPPTFLVHKKGFRDYQLKVFFCEKKVLFSSQDLALLSCASKEACKQIFLHINPRNVGFFPPSSDKNFSCTKKTKIDPPIPFDSLLAMH